MKVKMIKVDDNTEVELVDKQEQSTKFDYVKMITLLYEEKELGETVFVGEFDDVEKDSINQMIQDITSVVVNCGSSEEQ